MLGTLLPRPLSEGMARAMKADRVLAHNNAEVRRGYELRASRSEPGLEGAPPQREIAETTSPGGE